MKINPLSTPQRHPEPSPSPRWPLSGRLWIAGPLLASALLSCGAQPPGRLQTQSLGAQAASELTAPVGYVNIKAYGAKCDGVTDDTAALQRALDLQSNLYLPPGTCLAGTLQLRSNQSIVGEGPSSVLLQKPGSDYLLGNHLGLRSTADVSTNMHDIGLRSIKLRGQAGKLAFDEHAHLLNLNAVTDVLIDRVVFEGYVGDGFYLGSGRRGQERHNLRVEVRDSVFDGVVGGNRNGISIIDGTDVRILGTIFLRSGRPGMPGAIDIEPDYENDAFSRIRDITIDNCEFRDIRSDALIALILRPQDRLRYPSQNITISNIRGYGNGQPQQTGLSLGHTSWGATELPTEATAPLNVRVTGAQITGVYRPFMISQLKGAVIEHSTFSNARAFAYIGEGDHTGFNRDIALNHVVFDNVGYDASVGYKALTIYSNAGLSLNGVTVQNGTGLGIAFSSGRSSGVSIANTRIINNNGKLVYGIKRFSNHILTPATNRSEGISLVGVGGNDFLTQ